MLLWCLSFVSLLSVRTDFRGDGLDGIALGCFAPRCTFLEQTFTQHLLPTDFMISLFLILFHNLRAGPLAARRKGERHGQACRYR